MRKTYFVRDGKKHITKLNVANKRKTQQVKSSSARCVVCNHIFSLQNIES